MLPFYNNLQPCFFPTQGCSVFGGFGTLSGLCEIWTITAIAFERCRAISTPLTMARRLNNMQVSVCIKLKTKITTQEIEVAQNCLMVGKLLHCGHLGDFINAVIVASLWSRCLRT